MEWVTHSERAYFVTLTYNDQNVPLGEDGVPSLRKRKFQKWVQNTHGKVAPFRYYAVGEYGENTLRPHYHMAVFPERGSSVESITGAWKQGYTSTYELNENRAAYLAQYATKKLTKDTDERLGPNQEPEFRCSSTRPPIGAAFIPVLVRAWSKPGAQKVIAQRGDIETTWRLGRRVLPVPRYIRNKVRQELGIPEKHADRMQHDGYAERSENREWATIDWEQTKHDRRAHRAKKEANRLRYSRIEV